MYQVGGMVGVVGRECGQQAGALTMKDLKTIMKTGQKSVSFGYCPALALNDANVKYSSPPGHSPHPLPCKWQC